MSQIRTTKQGDKGAFPGSTFVIDGTPPNSQCQEAQIVDAAIIWTIGQSIITLVSDLDGISVIGKKATIAGSPGDDGTYNIIDQLADTVTIDHTFAQQTLFAAVTIHDAGQAYLTRDVVSFTRFIEHQSKAHTSKGGQLYTDIADPPMNAACSDTWAPE